MTDQEFMAPALEHMAEQQRKAGIVPEKLGFDKVVTEILDARNRFFKSCVAGQTILNIAHRIGKDTPIIGVYVKHDESSVTITKDGKERQVDFLDMEGVKKL